VQGATCRGSVRLRRAGRTLGSASYRINAGKRKAVRIRIARSAASKLRGSVAVVAQFTNRDEGGASVATQANLRLRG